MKGEIKMKYSKKEVSNYIYGNDTIADIEVLENDPEFMLEVMKMSNDKHFYNLCSFSVKSNYQFVSQVILKFREDSNFICKVANAFLENTAGKIEKIDELELFIIMKDLLPEESEESIRYSTLIEAKFQRYRLTWELVKLNNPDTEVMGMGFLSIYDENHTSSIITNYFAKRMVRAIFEEFDINLEEYLHTHFQSFDEIKKIGIRTYLLNFIAYYDEMLSSYLSTNTNLLEEYLEQIAKIGQHWNLYNHNEEEKKYHYILDYIHKYMEQIEYQTSFSELEILCYIANELGITKKILEYDDGLRNMYQKGFFSDEENQMMVDLVSDTKSLWSLEDYRSYHHLIDFVIRVLSGRNIEDEVTKQGNTNNIIDFPR